MVNQATADRLEETDDLDWKQDLPTRPQETGQWNEFAKDVAAMANTRGGLLICGVTKSIELRGIDPTEVNTQQYAQWIRNHVQPYLPDLEMYTLQDPDSETAVFVVDVPASEMAPHFVYGTSKGDKDQYAAVVPYRDKDHTAWMAEHQIERAYRDRFSRINREEEERQRSFDLTIKNIAAQAPRPSAWFVAVARPQRPLPYGARNLNRSQAGSVLHAARRAHHIKPDTFGAPGILQAFAEPQLSNPQPGLRSWVCSSLGESGPTQEALLELHSDGTVIAARNLSTRADSETPSPQQHLAVSRALLEASCYDLVASVQQLQRTLRLDSAQQVTVAVLPPHGPQAMALAESPLGLYGEEKVLPSARRPHHLQAVHTVLSPIVSDDQARHGAEEVLTDLLHQFGIQG